MDNEYNVHDQNQNTAKQGRCLNKSRKMNKTHKKYACINYEQGNIVIDQIGHVIHMEGIHRATLEDQRNTSTSNKKESDILFQVPNCAHVWTRKCERICMLSLIMHYRNNAGEEKWTSKD